MFLSCEADGYLFLLFLIVPTTLIENSQLLQERNAGEEIVNEQFHYMYWETCLCAVLLCTARQLFAVTPTLLQVAVSTLPICLVAMYSTGFGQHRT